MLLYELDPNLKRPMILSEKLKNGSIENGIHKMLEGYHSGRSHAISTCYNWVGYFLKNHSNYDNQNTTVRFWGLKKATLETSLIIHGDCVAPYQDDDILDNGDIRLDSHGRLLVSTSADGDYSKMQLVVEYTWTDLKNSNLD